MPPLHYSVAKKGNSVEFHDAECLYPEINSKVREIQGINRWVLAQQNPLFWFFVFVFCFALVSQLCGALCSSARPPHPVSAVWLSLLCGMEKTFDWRTLARGAQRTREPDEKWILTQANARVMVHSERRAEPLQSEGVKEIINQKELLEWAVWQGSLA